MNVTIKHDKTQTIRGEKNSGDTVDLPVREAIRLVKEGSADPVPTPVRTPPGFAAPSADRMFRNPIIR
jgi:hypothetical protein